MTVLSMGRDYSLMVPFMISFMKLSIWDFKFVYILRFELYFILYFLINQCEKSNVVIQAPMINVNENIYFVQGKKVRYCVYVYCTVPPLVPVCHRRRQL